jgi:bifunctional UDP-N-acetylglucosamine pyrophosphorylase/glucosamine-1-phosphate N-acetyltransferase
MKSVAGIVLAAGHGSVATLQNQSKLVEVVAGEPMVRRPVQILRDELKLSPTLVVVNTRFGGQVCQALADHPADWFVHQPERTGTAGAVKECLPQLIFDAADCDHVVVAYGDMPCWKPRTIANLVKQHIESDSILSMLRIDLRGEFAKYVENFGRILYDEHGDIIAVREPYEMTAEELAKARYVNPSAWVFDLRWLEEHLPHLEPHDKGDGFAHEYWLPDLVPMAVKQGRKILSIDLPDAREALGVNTLQQLEEVRHTLEEIA